MSFISLFEVIKVVVPEPCIFFWIPASIAKAKAAAAFQVQKNPQKYKYPNKTISS